MLNKKDVTGSMQAIQRMCHDIAKEKGFWDDPNFNISEKLMLIVSEVGEACEALRRDLRQKKDGQWEKSTFEDELADAVIRIFDLSEKLEIDMEWQIFNKLNYNKTRDKKHGKKF